MPYYSSATSPMARPQLGAQASNQRNAIANAMMNIRRPQPQVNTMAVQSNPLMGLPRMPPAGAPPMGAPTPQMMPPTAPLTAGASPPMGAGAAGASMPQPMQPQNPMQPPQGY